MNCGELMIICEITVAKQAPSRVCRFMNKDLPPALDTERAAIWGLIFMAFLGGMAVCSIVAGGIGPGSDFALLILVAMIALMVLLAYLGWRHSNR